MPPADFTASLHCGTFDGASYPPLSESLICSSAPLLIPRDFKFSLNNSLSTD